MGEDAIAIAAHPAGDRTPSRLATRSWPTECRGASLSASFTVATLHRSRRNELLSLYRQLQKRIQELDKEVEGQVRQRAQSRRLMTHPGVDPVTALVTDVFLGDASRFTRGNEVASYIGMIPCEDRVRGDCLSGG